MSKIFLKTQMIILIMWLEVKQSRHNNMNIDLPIASLTREKSLVRCWTMLEVPPNVTKAIFSSTPESLTTSSTPETNETINNRIIGNSFNPYEQWTINNRIIGNIFNLKERCWKFHHMWPRQYLPPHRNHWKSLPPLWKIKRTSQVFVAVAVVVGFLLLM